MPKRTPKGLLQHVRTSDLRGAVQLLTQATLGISRMAEGVHQAVWRTLGAPGGAQPGNTRGITGLVYRSINGVTQGVGSGLDLALSRLLPLLTATDTAPPDSLQRDAMLAALNGVLGDHLAASHNPLATPMTLRHQGQALDWQHPPEPSAVTGKVLLLLHGLCMNDRQWQDTRTGHDHGATLAAALGYTPVYVRYNSGLHTSHNAQDLSAQLETLFTHWPVPLTDITVLAHSMGGLVARGAVHLARQADLQWPGVLKNLVFLGTPHHGAPLERAGNWVDTVLASTPFSAPFAKLGHLRSAGITDLRYGHVLEADWLGHNRFHRQPDTRQPLPLPEGVACFTVAATLAAQRSAVAERLIGDGLVPLPSALGKHMQPDHTLVFAKDAQHIAYRTSHLQLLSSPAVSQQLLHWLA